MNFFLLIVGDGYYPQAGTRDWKKCYQTREEAERQVTRVPEYRTITKGKRKGEQEEYTHRYIVDGVKYDWYDIVDLRDWIQ